MSLPRYGRATHDYDAKTPQQISFKKNEILAVTHEDDTHNWFRGYLQADSSQKGIFPTNVVSIMEGYVPPDVVKQVQKGLSSSNSKQTDSPPPSPKQKSPLDSKHERKSSSKSSKSDKDKSKKHKSKTEKDKSNKKEKKDKKENSSSLSTSKTSFANLAGVETRGKRSSTAGHFREAKPIIPSTMDDLVLSVGKSNSKSKSTKSEKKSKKDKDKNNDKKPLSKTPTTIAPSPKPSEKHLKAVEKATKPVEKATKPVEKATKPVEKLVKSTSKLSKTSSSKPALPAVPPSPKSSSVGARSALRSSPQPLRSEKTRGSSGHHHHERKPSTSSTSDGGDASSNKPDHTASFRPDMDLETRLSSRAAQNDPLLQWPAKHIRVGKERRELRVADVEQAVPTEEIKALGGSVPPHVHAATAAATRDFIIVRRKHKTETSPTIPNLPLQSPFDEPDKSQRVNTKLTRAHLLPWEPTEQKSIDKTINDDAVPFFNVYSKKSDLGDAPINVNPPTLSPMSSRSFQQLRIDIDEFVHAIDVGEVFFFSLALYDVEKRVKLSETWHADINSSEQLRTIPERATQGWHDETRARSALFDIGGLKTSPRDVVLVVRIERVATADDAAGTELYTKTELKAKETSKARQEVDSTHTKIGQTLQPFAWSYVRPFASGSEADSNRNVSQAPKPSLVLSNNALTLDHVYRHKPERLNDEMLFEEVKKRDETKSTSLLQGLSIKLKAEIISIKKASALPGRLDSSLRALTPTPVDIAKRLKAGKSVPTPLIRELCSLGRIEPLSTMSVEYVNHLHVQAEWLDLRNHSGTQSARNIVCSISLRDNDQSVSVYEGLPVMYGLASQRRMNTKVDSPLTYRARRPQYYFEAKVELPAAIAPNTHLLFTFHHVAVRVKTGGLFSLEAKEDDDKVLGYACLPLRTADQASGDSGQWTPARTDSTAPTRNGEEPHNSRTARRADDATSLQLLQDGVHSLSVAKDLPESYLSPYVDESPSIAWADKKPVFQVKTTLCSSVHTNDSALATFFGAAGAKNDAKGTALVRRACESLKLANSSTLYSNIVVILDQLTSFIARGIASPSPFAALISVVTRVDTHTRAHGKTSDRNVALDTYIYYQFDNAAAIQASDYNNSFAEAFVISWLTLLEDGEKNKKSSRTTASLSADISQARALWYNVAWFLSALLSKSMAIEAVKQLPNESTRATRYSPSLVKALKKLIARMSVEIVKLSTTALSAMASLNRTLATLFCELFDVMDRGSVFEFIHSHLSNVRMNAVLASTNSSILAKQRLQLHAWLAQYEHYFVLNYPVKYSLESLASVRQDWWSRHYLIGALIDECERCLHNNERMPKRYAAATMRSVLSRHGKLLTGESLKRFADMCFPLLLVLCDVVDEILEDEDDSETSDDDNGGKDTPSRTLSSRSNSVMKLSRSRTATMSRRGTVSRTSSNAKGFKGLTSAFSVMGAALGVSKRPSSDKQRGDATQRTMSSHHGAAAPMSMEERRDWLACVLFLAQQSSTSLLNTWLHRDSAVRRAAYLELLTGAVRAFTPQDKHTNESRVATQIAISVATQHLTKLHSVLKKDTNVLCMVFSLLIAVLESAPPVDILVATFGLLRRFVHDYAEVIFRGSDTRYASDLCLVCLRYSSAPRGDVRACAVSLWYLLAQTNLRSEGNFDRFKLHSTIAMSSLAGSDDSDHMDRAALKSALEAVLRSATSDDGEAFSLNLHSSIIVRKGQSVESTRKKEGSFKEQLQQLTSRLFAVIKNSDKLAENKSDPEMTADLFHQLSKNYIESPVLRVTWLENLAHFQVSQSSWSEAACAYLMIASLSASYLTRKGGKSSERVGVPKSDDAMFKAVCAHIATEPGLPATEQEGIYDSHLFTREGFVSSLHNAVGFFLKAQYYELAVAILGTLSTTHLAAHDYTRLGRVAASQSRLCSQLTEANASQARLFAHFYRVGFYGKRWREFNGKQFVYKADAAQRVSEFSQALLDRFRGKFGDQVQLLAPGQKPDAAMSSAPNVAFVDVSTVKPDSRGDTPFERQHNVSHFVLEQPFTVGGSKYGSLTEQWKRRTLYSCSSTFPTVSARLPVVDVDEKLLSPLVCAVETVKEKCDALRAELDAPSPDLKTLQLILQGSVLLQVNEGPLAIARAFLSSDFNAENNPTAVADTDDVAKNQSKLRKEFERFVTTLQEGLILNGQLIGSDQLPFQHELELGFANTVQELEQFKIRAKLQPTSTSLPSTPSTPHQIN